MCLAAPADGCGPSCQFMTSLVDYAVIGSIDIDVFEALTAWCVFIWSVLT